MIENLIWDRNKTKTNEKYAGQFTANLVKMRIKRIFKWKYIVHTVCLPKTAQYPTKISPITDNKIKWY